jgi:hypothetical protein
MTMAISLNRSYWRKHMSAVRNIFTRGSRPLAGVIAALGAIALGPAVASASTTWFGSSLDHTPANAGSTCSQDGVGNAGDLCTHVGSDYPGFSGHAQSKTTGTIVQLKVRPEGPMTFTAKVVTVRRLAADFKSGQAKVTARSRLITVPGPTQSQMDDSIYPVEKFKVSLKVKKGQEIAIDTTSNTAEYCSDGTPGQLLFDPILGLGHGFRNSAGVDGCLMLIQAVVKP